MMYICINELDFTIEYFVKFELVNYFDLHISHDIHYYFEFLII